jgi:predicted RNA binding protein YcfA (HicA-like mRNA interferase family)
MKSSELIRKFQRAGWIEIRQTGSHKIFKNPKTG